MLTALKKLMPAKRKKAIQDPPRPSKFPEMPEKNIISLPLVRVFCETIPEDDPRKKVASLFLENLELDKRAMDIQERCIGKPGFGFWKCCDDHRKLKLEGENLCERVDAVGPNENCPDIPVGSEYWWRSMGFDYPYADQIINTDEGMGDHYVKTTISIKLAREWIAALPKEDDRRRLFANLYFDFLGYHLRSQNLAEACKGRSGHAADCCEEEREQLDHEWAYMQEEATRLTATAPRNRWDDWQDKPVLSQEWWEGLVLDWRDGAIVVAE